MLLKLVFFCVVSVLIQIPVFDAIWLVKLLYLLQEVYLLKRDPDSMLVQETWHIRGPFDGNTLTSPPVWPGSWLIDVLACIHECQDHRSFWLKAMHRSVPSAPSDQ